MKRYNVFWILILTAFLFAGCSSAKGKLFVASPYASLQTNNILQWQDIRQNFTWNEPFGPRSDELAGDRIHITPVETEEEWKEVDDSSSKNCINFDFDHQFATAYHLKWQDKIVIKYCYREGKPDSKNFRFYYLPVVEIPLSRQIEKLVIASQPAEKEKDQEEEQLEDPKAEILTPAENKIADESKKEEPESEAPKKLVTPITQPPEPERTIVTEQLAKADDLSIYYTNPATGLNFTSQEDVSKAKTRFIIIKFKSERIYMINLGDMQTYLDQATNNRLLRSPKWAQNIRENTIYWKAMQPLGLDLTMDCRACKEARDPVAFKAALLSDKQLTMFPRMSCLDLSKAIPDGFDTHKIGFAHQGFGDGKHPVGYLLIKKQNQGMAFPVDFCAKVHTDQGMSFSIEGEFEDVPAI